MRGGLRSVSPVLVLALAAAVLPLAGRPVLPAETVVSLQFDDTHASQYQVRQMLLDHGMRATFFILSSRIDRSGYMTLGDLRDLQNDGNEIGGHTLGHHDLTTLSAAEAERQVCEDRAALISHGFDPVSFAYTFGAYNQSVQAIVANCGYVSARTVGGIGGCASCPSAETLPPTERHATRTRASVKVDMTLAMLQSYVTAAEDSGGGWVQIVFHHLCEGSTCPTLSVTPSNLAAFLDWLAPRAARGTVVKTVREALDLGAPPPPTQETVPPFTVMHCSPRGCSEWSNGPVTVSLSATDDDSGVAEIRYTTDGTEPTRTNGSSRLNAACSFTLPASATVKFRAYDAAGNAEATQTQVIRIDTSPPVTEMQCSPRGCSEVSDWPVTVTLSATDDASGVAEIRYTTDGTEPDKTYGSSCSSDGCSFTLPSRATVRFRAYDVAGNAEETQSQAIQPAPVFIRGDTNVDGRQETADALAVLGRLFLAGEEVACQDAADVNDDGRVDVSDAIGLLFYLFAGGDPPRPPHPDPGLDPTEDSLGCERGLMRE